MEQCMKTPKKECKNNPFFFGEVVPFSERQMQLEIILSKLSSFRKINTMFSLTYGT